MSSIAAATTPGYGWSAPGVFQKGKGKTLAIPMSVHAAAREKLCAMMKKAPYNCSNGVMLVKGGEDQCQYDSDTELVFRQDSWFNYLFGVKEPGMYGAINIETGKSTLFIPRLDIEYEIYCGKIHTADSFKTSYAVDEVCFVDEIASCISSNLSSGKLHLMDGENSDSGLRAEPASFAGSSTFHQEGKVEIAHLHHALSTCRVVKSPYEIEVMRYCAWVASNAHVQVMRSTKAGMIEYELEATFAYEIYAKGGCRRCAYTAICACGPSAATLHYGHAGAPNDRPVQPTDMCLLDMGADYHGYVSDITCSFPVGENDCGKFSADQKAIYEGVLAAQVAVSHKMAPGVSWPDCHIAADHEILTALVGVGVLVGDVAAMQEVRLGAVFMPHGLGHLIGCDTHDVGGYVEGTPERSPHPGVGKLRTSRVMEEGMVMTSEPGCYFIDALLDAALANDEHKGFFNLEVLARFRGFGGVRLEDVVVVTSDGVENLTTCPRTVEEVESVRSGGQWPPVEDKMPELKRAWKMLDAKKDATKMVDSGVVVAK